MANSRHRVYTSYVTKEQMYSNYRSLDVPARQYSCRDLRAAVTSSLNSEFYHSLTHTSRGYLS